MGYRYLAIVLGSAAMILSSPLAAQITGPIDTGTVRTDRLQLSQAQPVQATPAPSRAPTTRAPARNLDIKAFFGSFAGSGIADSEDIAYLGVTQRDLDVRIGPAEGGGVTIAWTTVVRSNTSNQNPENRRRATTMTFMPGPRPGLFRAIDNSDPLNGGTLAWARIARDTLTVHLFSVQADGRHEIQTYARTLSGSGMDLVYTRVVDGERQRRVRGKLVKNAN
jgi:hypothetical protein